MSDLLKNPAILRQIIMDHYEYPRNHELLEDTNYVQKHMESASCIDDIYVQVHIQDHQIKDIRFDGVACTIATASTSIMSDLLRGKSLKDASVIINNFFAMIDGDSYDEDMLEEAIAFHMVGKQANRIKCATIGWNAIKEIIAESEGTHEK